MTTHRLLAVVIAALLGVALPLPSPAAEIAVDVSSFAPRDAGAVIQQIELNVLLKQYEKLVTQIEDSRLEYELHRVDSDGTDAQKKEQHERMVMKMETLERMVGSYRLRIMEIVQDANKKAEAIEKEKAAEKAKKKVAQSSPAARNPV
jgi:hypothetical protein